MSWVVDGMGRFLARYLEKPVQGYEPFTPSDPGALRATLRPAVHHRAAIGIDQSTCLGPGSPCLACLIGTTPHVARNHLALLFVPRRCIGAQRERNRKRN